MAGYARINKNVIDINFGRQFPWQFQFVGGILLFVAVLQVSDRVGLSIFLLVFSVFIFSASEGTEINREKKIFREYKSFFFLKTGSWSSYDRIEKIFVNSFKSSQQMFTAHTTKSSIFTNDEFNGFLKFDDGEKIQLLRKKDKASLLQSLKNISTFLEVPLEDITGS